MTSFAIWSSLIASTKMLKTVAISTKALAKARGAPEVKAVRFHPDAVPAPRKASVAQAQLETHQQNHDKLSFQRLFTCLKNWLHMSRSRVGQLLTFALQRKMSTMVDSPKPADERLPGAARDEASVHRPHHGRLSMASFRNEEGKQQWKVTGLTSHQMALNLGQEWENNARQIRVFSGDPKRSLGHTGGLSQPEVAAILNISVRAVRQIEQRAIAKLPRHPALRRVWREFFTGEVEESRELGVEQLVAYALSFPEVVARFGLTSNRFERRGLERVFIITVAPITPEFYEY